LAAAVRQAAQAEPAATTLSALGRGTRARPRSAARFCCLLDEQPGYLVPERFLDADRAARELIVNPSCWFSWHADPAEEAAALAKRFAGSLCGNHETAWVQDVGSGAWLPFCVGPRFRELLSGARPGQAAPANLPEDARDILTVARVLGERGAAAERRKQWVAEAGRCADRFRRGYVALPALLHPLHLGELRRYLRQQVRAGVFRLGDGQSPRRYVAHNEPVTRFFHEQLTDLVSDVAGEPLKPSYVYAASYQSGAKLAKHTDRPQCEFSITLCVDFTPEPEGETPWPIHLDTAEGTVTVSQALGDGLMYRGTKLPHYRGPLAAGCTSTSIFFHYVRESFKGKLD
jgi:hypothetical protein